MGKFIASLGLVLGLALLAIGAAGWRLLDNPAGGATAMTLAGGLFTVALAAALDG
jgi:hypothetical protein